MRAQKNWQSDRYLLTNLDTDVMDQAVSFLHNEDGSQTYLYERVSEVNGYYSEFSDGGTDYIYYYNIEKINDTLGTNLT